MSVEVARTSIYPNGFDALDSSSSDTDEFIKSVKDSLQRGHYDTTAKAAAAAASKHHGVIDSEDEQPSLPLDDEADIGSLEQGGNSLTEVVEVPLSDDEDDAKWLSAHLQNNLVSVRQASAGVEDLVMNYPNDGMKDNDGAIDCSKESDISNHCCATTKPPMLKHFARRKTYGQLPNNSVTEQLVELLKKRSRSLTHLDTQELLDLRLNNNSDFNHSDVTETKLRPYNHSDISETKHCNESTPKSRRSSRETEETPHRVPKKRCSSGDSRNSVGGDSSHRYSEASSYSDSDSLRRRYFGWGRRFSNYSVATTVQTTLSSFIEPETALDLAENLMVELFDTDDIDGIIPARFLQTNQEAIVDNIREEEYTPSYSPTASCDQSSFDDDFLPQSFAGESTSELRFSNMSSPHNTGSPRSSRHSKSSSPERMEPISSYPIEGGMPRASIWSMNMNMQLDTVEEETASQISPSPRVMSPRISIDNGESFDALADLQTKQATQPTTHRLSVPYMRKISLQRDHPREHHRFSVESMPVSENSFYFSVTSFDDEIVNKMEMIDDQMPSPMPSPKLDRRQRKVGTVSSPSSTVLQWLANMPKDPPQSLDPDDPWPFNEDVASSTAASEVVMETLTVPERRISLSETSDLDSFHSCRDDYAASNISGQDSFDCTQLDVNHNDQITDQGGDQDKDATLRKELSLDQQPAHRRQRLKQQREAIDYDDY